MAVKKSSKTKKPRKSKETPPAQEQAAPSGWMAHPIFGIANPRPEKRRMPWFGWLGLAIMVLAEIFLTPGDHPLALAFTPIMWSGYILFVDGWIWQRHGDSYFIERRREFPMLFLISILLWSMFEVINFKTRTWHYDNIPSVGMREFLGAWAYGTIIPALFRTWDFFATLKMFEKAPAHHVKVTPFKLAFSFIFGVACIGIPLLMSDYWANFLIPCIWLGFIFLVEPINYLLNIPRISIFRQLEMGNSKSLWQLLVAGLFCGVIWESFNAEAVRAGGLVWIYTLNQFWVNLGFGIYPIRNDSMPLMGFGGYPPFIWENFVMYELIKYAMQGNKMWKTPGQPHQDDGLPTE
ncbi:MAG TPA: hypothetical protein PKK96_04230 [Anaerolineales bacterium]|nr:hypothetical protein [Anaerolineales bacterium]HMS00570.1 hypothetical protein [Anaerolineales bacterium]HNQ93469.1 hypothetical protein [Anaerolineales bacterium]HNS60190.1 hypothetical protein [Anaerolineales bacterium]